MRLPVKILPKVSQQVIELFGAMVILGTGATFVSDFASPSDLRRYHSFGEWLGASAWQLPFLILSSALLLLGLGWFTVALLNLFGGSPFNYLVVDRFGLSYRNFWGERRFSWKDLGPIRALKLSAWRAHGHQLRFWIAADTVGSEAAGGSFLWLWTGLSGPDLRIPASTYLGSGWLVGSIALATDSAASWLEELRLMAKQDDLESEEVPEAPHNFREPIELDYAAARSPIPEPEPGPTPAAAPDRRPGPTVER